MPRAATWHAAQFDALTRGSSGGGLLATADAVAYFRSNASLPRLVRLSNQAPRLRSLAKPSSRLRFAKPGSRLRFVLSAAFSVFYMFFVFVGG